MAFSWQTWRGKLPASEADYKKEIEQLREKAPIPSIWMFGKTGSGKSSAIRYLTGAEDAVVGEGYRPETRFSRRYDFPDSLEPLLTFIDTRGLGEASYDPQEDIARFSETTQLMLVTVRVTDHALQTVIEPLRRIREAMPHRPVLLTLTCLHEANGQVDITAQADPFETVNAAKSEPAAIESQVSPTIPRALQTLLDEKATQFKGLYDILIPIDLTRPEDGFSDPNFGGQRLKQAILDYLPHAYRQALLSLHETDRPPRSALQQRARWQVLASSALAATAGAVPLPWVDIPAVLGIQAHLAVRLSKIHEQELTPKHWAVLSSAAGSRIALRMIVRESLKFIPLVGMAAGAASSFAFTYALGMSWDWYFADLRRGHVPSAEQLQEVFAQQLKRGRELWRAR
jgi:uncharacterized protein (DUF697 family)